MARPPGHVQGMNKDCLVPTKDGICITRRMERGGGDEE